jgi:DNA-binding transcriptional LysR family regulator
LANATWIVREPGSGTREASDRWLVPALGQVTVEMELGSNEAVKRAVACGLGLGCLSRHAVADAVTQGSLAELKTPLPVMRRTLAIVVHKGKPLGSAAQGFLTHCMGAVRQGAPRRHTV